MGKKKRPWQDVDYVLGYFGRSVYRAKTAYMVDIGEFLSQTEYLPPNVEPVGESKRLSIISWTQAGNWQQICDTSQYGDYGEYVETDAKGIFALRVRGDETRTR